MPIEDGLLELLTRSWPRVWSDLAPDQRQAVSLTARELALAAQDEQALGRAALKLMRVLRRALPADHPVLLAAEGDVRWAQAPDVDWAPVIGALSLRIEEMVRDEVQGRLAAAVSLSAEQMRAAGEDPGQPFLVRLETGSGGVRFPAFQFSPQGGVISVVLQVNELLGAADDPWGVADWWLGDNAWLDAVPADLIGVADGSLLAAAAAAADPESW
jgi:hypothetical protein